MTASTSLASVEYDIEIHSAPTLDMRPFPVIDVGRCPDASEPTFVGTPPPERLPYVRATCVLPDLDSCSDDDLSDLAANVCGDTQAAADDLWALAGSQAHIRAVCQLLGSLEMAAFNKDERIDRLGQTTAQLSTDLRQTADQLAVARGVGERLEWTLRIARESHKQTVLEMHGHVRELAGAQRLLRTERERLDREATMHRETVSRLIKQTAESYRLGKDVSRLTEEVRVLRAALEKCEKCERGAK